MNNVDVEDFPELQHARGLWNAGRVDIALTAFETAVRLRSTSVRAHVEFARALGQLHEIARAERLLEQALVLTSGQATAMIVVAQAFRSIFRQRRALELLDGLREKSLLPPAMLGELAVLYEQSGEFDRGLDVIDECILMAPERYEPQLIRARMLRHRGELEQAERLLRQLAAISGAPPMLLVGCQSELCYVLDRRGEYEAAMEAMERAKQVLRSLPGTPQLRENSRRLSHLFAQLYADLDEATVGSWIARQDDVASDGDDEVGGIAHLIGFPRSGTTLLEQSLDAHPWLVTAPERAVFSKLIFPRISQHAGRSVISAEALDRATDDTLRQQAHRYLRLHREIHGQPWKGRTHIDKNPNHMSLLAGLLRLLPASRFIVALRDPRDVIVSTYLRYFPLSEYSAAFLDWKSTCQLYASEMSIWIRMREMMHGNWIEVRYEELVADLPRETAKIVKFLGREWQSEGTDYRAQTQAKFVNSPSHAEVRQPIYAHAIGRWRNYRKYLEPVLDDLPHF